MKTVIFFIVCASHGESRGIDGCIFTFVEGGVSLCGWDILYEWYEPQPIFGRFRMLCWSWSFDEAMWKSSLDCILILFLCLVCFSYFFIMVFVSARIWGRKSASSAISSLKSAVWNQHSHDACHSRVASLCVLVLVQGEQECLASENLRCFFCVSWFDFTEMAAFGAYRFRSFPAALICEMAVVASYPDIEAGSRYFSFHASCGWNDLQAVPMAAR